MRKLFIFPLICVVAGCMLISCRHDDGVRAGNEQGSDTYQPRAAPKPETTPDKERSQDIRGELIRVDVPRRTFAIRVESGMEQTFKFDDQTMVMGLDATTSRVRDLVGKEGSEITVQWREDGDVAKMAAHVTVTQLNVAKPARKGTKKR